MMTDKIFYDFVMLHFYTLLLLKNFFSNLFWKNQWRILKKWKILHLYPLWIILKTKDFDLLSYHLIATLPKCHLEKGIGMAFKWHTLYIFTFLLITTFTPPCLPMLQKGLEEKIRLGFVPFEQKSTNFPNDILWLLEVKCLYWEIF